MDALNDVGVGPSIMAMLFLGMSIHSGKRLLNFHRQYPRFNFKKQFVISHCISSVLRCLCFLIVSSISFGFFSFPSYTTQNFQDKVIIILMSAPEVLVLMNYSFLVLVWTDFYLQSRSHWLSSGPHRRYWHTFQLVLRAISATGLVSLYVFCLALPVERMLMMELVAYYISGLNLLFAVLQFFAYFSLSYVFSGFPYRSQKAHYRLSVISNQICIWTFCRLLWGSFVFICVFKNWWFTVVKVSDSLAQSKAEVLVCFCFVALYCLLELGPTYLNLKAKVLRSLVLHVSTSVDSRAGSSSAVFEMGMNYGATINGRFKGTNFHPFTSQRPINDSGSRKQGKLSLDMGPPLESRPSHSSSEDFYDCHQSPRLHPQVRDAEEGSGFYNDGNGGGGDGGYMGSGGSSSSSKPVGLQHYTELSINRSRLSTDFGDSIVI